MHIFFKLLALLGLGGTAGGTVAFQQLDHRPAKANKSSTKRLRKFPERGYREMPEVNI